MLLKVDGHNRIGERVALRAMFEARKRVFVDLLKWDIPVLDGRFEIDQFDDAHAIYIILTDRDHRHLASARLLPTTRPGLLNTLYRHLAAQPLPVANTAYEITRFCLSPDIPARDRRSCRDALITALVRFALDRGIQTYTGLAEAGWLKQILAFGWDCSLLGPLQTHGRSTIGALRIHITADTLAQLERSGIYGAPDALVPMNEAA